MGCVPSSCWSEVFWELSPSNARCYCWHWLPPELNGKTLFLKAPHILATGGGEIKLVLTRKFPPCWIAFTVLGGAMQTIMGEKNQYSPPQ